MSKSTKIITSVVAIALVIAAMVVGIYAATTGGATISASVSWQAADGIELTLKGQASNGSETVSTNDLKIEANTTNNDAKNINTAAKTLDIDFIDKTSGATDDGVNTAEPIDFTYTVKNDSTDVYLTVKLTKAPTTNNDKNVAVTSATASVDAGSEEGVYAQLTGAETSVTVAPGSTLTIEISIDVQDDNAPVTAYDAGVVFSFGIGTAPQN